MVVNTVSTTDSIDSNTATFGELMVLLKPRVMSLVVFTGAVGLLIAPTPAGGAIAPFFQLLAIACIALGSGAGGMINMWVDRDIDPIMKRTASRPIPAGKVAPDDVLLVGLLLAITSVGLMGLVVNWLAAGLLGFAIFFYAVIYSMWLKRSTPQNIVIGGAAGAFPPMIGWAAITGDVTLEPMLLFAIIFLWTPPHFWALALFRHEDYQRANIPMLPVTHGIRHTTIQMMIYSVLLVICSLLLVLMPNHGLVYAVGATLLGLPFLWLTWKVYRTADQTMRYAKQLFGYSILYLFALFATMVVDVWAVSFYNVANI